MTLSILSKELLRCQAKQPEQSDSESSGSLEQVMSRLQGDEEITLDFDFGAEIEQQEA